MKQIVVLAGGKGTRLYPLTKSIPKSLVLINEEPFISHQIKLFKKNNISEIILCIGIFYEKIKNFLDENNNLEISIKYSLEDTDNLLGTLGALKNAFSLLDDEFFLIYGDSYLELDFQEIAKAFSKSGKLGLMTVYKNNDNLIPSNVSVHNGMVIDYDKENPKKFDYVDFGLSIFKKKILNYFPPDTKLDLSQLHEKLISINQLQAFEVKSRFYEIGSYDGIKDLENHLKK